MYDHSGFVVKEVKDSDFLLQENPYKTVNQI